MMRTKLGIVTIVAVILIGLFIYLQPVSAAPRLYTAEPRTIELGKQGLFISNLPVKIKFVEIEKIRPPLLPKYTIGVDIAYRGPALDINFMNENFATLQPTPTLSSVYFNISEPEVKFWEEGGINEIAIWYYSKKSEKWQYCPTRFVAEKLNNGKYDRLACFVMGNGIYLLGKMEIDPMFSEWFRPHTKSEAEVEYLMGLID
jgi:hypothetical protein